MSIFRLSGQRDRNRGCRKAVFLDRDGVVIADKHYLADPDQVEVLPGVVEAMASLYEAGYLLIGISNQSGIGRGRFTPADHQAVMHRLVSLLAQGGVEFDGFFFCPHAPDDGCDCRKPLPGLLDEAALYFQWRSSESWVIGDKVSDVELGRRAGMRSAMVLTGHGRDQETEFNKRWGDDPDVVLTEDLPAFVEYLLGRPDLESDP